MLVAKYKFDKSIYENLIPVFNDGYEGYTVSDEIDSENENYVIRTIECDVLPTYIRFGVATSDISTNRELSLLEVIELNTTELTNCNSMFIGCKNVTSINTEGWILNKVTAMQYMFYYCSKLTSLDVSNFDTSKVSTMEAMFYSCFNLTSLDISNWDTSNVTNMQSIFRNCYNLTSLDVSNWDTSNVTNMKQIFLNTSSLQYIRCNNTSTINTLAPLLYDRTSSTQGKIITTSSTDIDTTTLSSLNWSVDTSNGTKIAEYKFDKSIWNYLVPEFNDGYGGYFVNDRIEDEVNSPNIVTRELVGYGGLPTLMRFGEDRGDVTNINLSKQYSLLEILYLNISNLNGLQSMFRFCTKLKKIECENWDTSKIITLISMFASCESLTQLDISNWDTSNIINMNWLFHNCYNLTTLDVSNFDTSNVTTMRNMFRNCNKLTSLDLSNFNTSNVTDMQDIFSNCNKLTSLDLSNWNTSNVTSMQGMFQNCNNLTSLDLSNFDTSKVTTMGWMFNGCNNLTSLDLSNFNTSNVTNFTSILNNTLLLTDIGMLYCSQDTINKLMPLITDGSKTIWVKDTNASDYTATDYVTIKDYKEDNRTLYLNSPLLEGDEIVNKDGGLYHYHKMGSVVLDGSDDEGWNRNNEPDGSYGLFRTDGIVDAVCNMNPINIISDTLTAVYPSNPKTGLTYTTSSGKLQVLYMDSLDPKILKQWLQENPTTVVYELAEPYYELISDDPLIVQSYAEGKLDTSSIITPTSIQSIPYEEELTYLYTSTQYCIQFYSTANCTVDITLGGTKVESKSVSVGLNKIYITTPSELVDNKLIINAKGSATISEVVVVNSNAEFDYFDGLKSSFEDCLVTDVDNENYGKYEVGVKIVGKNKFDGEVLDNSAWSIDKLEHFFINDYFSSKNIIPVKPNTEYRLSCNGQLMHGNIHYRDLEGNFIGQIFIQGSSNSTEFTSKTPNNCYYITFQCHKNNFDINGDIQLEEGITATSYEPYKETNATIYLNSPLLQGDRVEVVDGKLCHYHKMGSVVLDGSEEGWTDNSSYYPSDTTIMPKWCKKDFNISVNNTVISDNFSNQYISDHNNIEGILQTVGGLDSNNNSYGGMYFRIYKSKLPTSDLDGFKQWLQANPTTVVYELAEPYYEDITPIQSSFVISTVSEGDMEILTDLPIKSNITYLTNITSAVLMEQQLDELDNSTESLTNIVEDEINE